MSSLYVDRKNVELRLSGEAIVFYENETRIGSVPIAPIDRVIFYGNNKVDTSLLGKLGEKGIGVVVLSGRKAQPTMLMAKPHNDAARRVKQYQFSLKEDFCLAFTRSIIDKKVGNQLAVLQQIAKEHLFPVFELNKAIEHIKKSQVQINSLQTIDSLRGLEGHIASEYFSGLGAVLPNSLNFVGRNRRPPRDPFNAVLSLGYTLLHSEAVVAVYASGLDPYVGFYHKLDFGRESLACDVIEPIRPLFDYFARQLFKNQVLRPEHFSTTEEGCFMGKVARSKFYEAYDVEAERFRKELNDLIADLSRNFRQEICMDIVI